MMSMKMMSMKMMSMKDDFEIKSEKKGFSIGITSSLGLVSGSSFSNIPYGGTIILSTPYGFQIAGITD